MVCAWPEWTEVSGTPVGIHGMQSLQFPTPLSSSLSSPLFSEDLGMGHWGKKILQWLQQRCCSTEHHFRIKALLCCTAWLGPTPAQPPSPELPSLRPGLSRAPALLVSCPGPLGPAREVWHPLVMEWMWCCQCCAPT